MGYRIGTLVENGLMIPMSNAETHPPPIREVIIEQPHTVDAILVSLTFTCSKSTIETLVYGVKYVQT